MAYTTGDCFVALPEDCANGNLILGRNALGESADSGVAQEVYYYEASEAAEGQCDGGAEHAIDGELRVILQKPRPGVWGGDCGANERNVGMAVTWSENEAANGSGALISTDIVRLTLANAKDALSGVERVGKLVTAHNADESKMNFIICDPTEAWMMSCGGKHWAAQRIKKVTRLPSDGLTVTTTIDKSSDGLEDALQTLGHWNGESPLNFAACFGAEPTEQVDSLGISLILKYTQSIMFETLRVVAADTERSRSSTVFVLTTDGGISTYWFTATPNALVSVFKPFVFSPNPKISPLTKVPADSTITLLHKLHAQRKPAALDDLKSLEASCVKEIDAFLAEHSVADEELDELMKDCVEAEVKFYR